MLNIKTRIAKIEDLPEIVNIYNQAIIQRCSTGDLNPYTVEDRLDWFNNHDSDKYPILVGSIDKKIVGYIYLSPYRIGREGLKYTVEVSYYIHIDYQRMGVGTILLKTIIEKAVLLKYRIIIAILFDVNTGSIRLLKKFNFKKWGKLLDVISIDDKTYSHLYYGLRL